MDSAAPAGPGHDAGGAETDQGRPDDRTGAVVVDEAAVLVPAKGDAEGVGRQSGEERRDRVAGCGIQTEHGADGGGAGRDGERQQDDGPADADGNGVPA